MNELLNKHAIYTLMEKLLLKKPKLRSGEHNKCQIEYFKSYVIEPIKLFYIWLNIKRLIKTAP